MKTLQVGDRIKLTGKFLRSTGQATGSEGLSKWVVQPCDCRMCKAGTHVRTNEPAVTDGWYTADELADNPGLYWRHLGVMNVYKVGTVDVRNSP